MSLVTCHPMIVFTSSRFFISYSLASDFFIALRVVMVFNAKRNSLTYTLTMLVLLLNCRMRMLGFPLSCLKPMLLKKAITFWFQSLPDCLSLYRLLYSLHNSFFRIYRSLCIPGDSHMNMGNLLSSKRLSRYASTMFT